MLLLHACPASFWDMLRSIPNTPIDTIVAILPWFLLVAFWWCCMIIADPFRASDYRVRFSKQAVKFMAGKLIFDDITKVILLI